MSTHRENWAGFPSMIDDAPALVTTDLGWADYEEPDGMRPTLLRVGIAAPAMEEEEAFSAFLESVRPFDEALTEAILAELNGAFVGTLFTESQRWWIFYAPVSAGADKVVREAARKAPGHMPELLIDRDPEWSFYAEVLFPDESQLRYIADRSVVDELEEQGDESDVPRPIEHRAFFPDAKSRDRFVKWCGKNGFEVAGVSGEMSDELEGFSVEFTHVGPAVIDDICEKTLLATEGAEKSGGAYDGWQTSIVKDGKPLAD